MSVQCEVTAKRSRGEQPGIFERYLTLWVALCDVAGITLGHLLPAIFQYVGGMEVAQVNLPVAVLTSIGMPTLHVTFVEKLRMRVAHST